MGLLTERVRDTPLLLRDNDVLKRGLKDVSKSKRGFTLWIRAGFDTRVGGWIIIKPWFPSLDRDEDYRRRHYYAQ